MDEMYAKQNFPIGIRSYVRSTFSITVYLLWRPEVLLPSLPPYSIVLPEVRVSRLFMKFFDMFTSFS